MEWKDYILMDMYTLNLNQNFFSAIYSLGISSIPPTLTINVLLLTYQQYPFTVFSYDTLLQLDSNLSPPWQQGWAMVAGCTLYYKLYLQTCINTKSTRPIFTLCMDLKRWDNRGNIYIYPNVIGEKAWSLFHFQAQ